MHTKFEKSLIKIDYIAFGLIINNKVPIYDLSKRTIVSLLFFKWSLNITIIKTLII